MNIDKQKFNEEIGLFLARLSPTNDQKHYLKFTEAKIVEELLSDSKKTGHPIERVLLTAICGNLTTKQMQAEFVSRLILLNILTQNGAI
jgi:hypothetical protein